MELAVEQAEPAAAVAPAAVVEPAAADGFQGQQAVWQTDGTGDGPSAAVPQEKPEAATEAATGTAATSSSGAGHQWYVFSYLAASLAWRGEFLASCAGAFEAADGWGQAQEQVEQAEQQQLQQPSWEQAVATSLEGLQAASRGAAVLRRYRFSPSTGGRSLHEGGSLLWDHLPRACLSLLSAAFFAVSPLTARKCRPSPATCRLPPACCLQMSSCTRISRQCWMSASRMA